MRKISKILAVLLVFSLLPMSAFAASTPSSDKAESLVVRVKYSDSSVYKEVREFNLSYFEENKVESNYALINRIPAACVARAEGVYLEDLIQDSNISVNNVTGFSFYSTDNQSVPIKFTKAELLDTPRYYYPVFATPNDSVYEAYGDKYGGGLKIKDMAALESGKVLTKAMLSINEDFHKNIDSSTFGDANRFRFLYGSPAPKVVQDEYNNNINLIRFNAENSRKWIFKMDLDLNIPDPNPSTDPGGNPGGNPGGTSEPPTEGEKGKIDVNGISVITEIKNGALTGDISSTDAGKIFDAAGTEGAIFKVTASKISHAAFTFTDADKITDSKLKDLTFELPSKNNVTYSKEFLTDLFKNVPNPQFVIKDGSIIVSILSDGKEVSYSDYKNPIKLETPYTKTATETDKNIVLSKNGKAIPRSSYKDGIVRANVYSTGTYSVSYNAPKSFTDAQTWMKEAVDYMNSRGVIEGKSTTLFGSLDNTTREEFATMLIRAMGVTASDVSGTSKSFKDEGKISSFAKSHVDVASKLEIILGDNNGNFNPKDKITRQEMFTMIYRAMEKFNMIPAGTSSADPSFSDFHQTADFAKESIAKLTNLGLIAGTDGKLLPKDNTNRAGTAQAFYNVLNYEFK